MQKEQEDFDIPEMPYKIIKSEFNRYYNKEIKYTITSLNWRIQPTVLILDLLFMTNIAYLYFHEFPGCLLSISIAEMKSGPYIEIYKQKLFTKSKEKKISLYNLPCRYVRLDCLKGKLEPQRLKIHGFHSENIEESFGKDSFKLLVSQPQKILYEF